MRNVVVGSVKPLIHSENFDMSGILSETPSETKDKKESKGTVCKYRTSLQLPRSSYGGDFFLQLIRRENHQSSTDRSLMTFRDLRYFSTLPTGVVTETLDLNLLKTTTMSLKYILQNFFIQEGDV